VSRGRVAAGAVALALAAPGAAAGAAPAPRALEIRVEAPSEADRAVLQPLLGLAPGEPVTIRALRRTVQRLWQTGRCRTVVVRQAPATQPPGEPGAWVQLTVDCQPHRLLASLALEVEGSSPVDQAVLRAAAGLRLGEPVDGRDVAEARERIGTLLSRRGHRQAQVEAEEQGTTSVALRLLVRPGPAARIAEVRLPGAGSREAGLVAALATRPGQVLDEERLEGDVERLRRALHAAGARRARIGEPSVEQLGDGVRVSIPVEPGPQVVVTLRGLSAFRPGEVLPALALDEQPALDAPAIDAAADRLLAFYRSRGHAAARVEAEEGPLGDAVEVRFHVAEGRVYRFGEIRVEGEQGRARPGLRDRLLALLAEEQEVAVAGGEAERARALAASIPGVRGPREPPPPLPPQLALDEGALERAAAGLAEERRNDGYLEAALRGLTVALDARRGVVEVVVRLAEGPRYLVESIGFEGARAIPAPELARVARLAPGDPLTFEAVEATRAALLRTYLERGHVYARVEAVEVPDPATDRAAVRYVVDEGPQVRIGQLVVSGNRRTLDEVVRAALEVHEGATWDGQAVARSQASLLGLNVFRSVELRLQDPETPEPVKDLAVTLTERPWQYLASGAGFSIANGPRLILEYGQPNLLGRALELSVRGKVNYPLVEFRPDLAGVAPTNRFEGRMDAGLRAPRFFALPAPLGGRLDLIAERIHRQAYDLTRASSIVGLDFALTGRAAVSLQYELEVAEISKRDTAGVLTQIDVERLRFDSGVTTLHAVRPVATLDFRDNSAHPRTGWFATGAISYERSLGGPGGRFLGLVPGSEIYTNLIKLTGTATGYLPVGRQSVLALSVRGGRVYPLSPRSRTIIPRRFFLGGASTLRGFAEEEMIPEDVRDGLAAEARHCASSLSGVGCTAQGRDLVAGRTAASEGGEAFLLLKGEVRLALGGSLEAGLFVDVGNLWLDPATWRFVDLRPSAGVGLRFVTPIGPAALDLGFNVTPDRRINERTFAPHFTIGLF
jgi:outer membrane protein assembly factor BamA